jgi:shikimate kinase
MGAGKTTVGQALAAKLTWQFVDLDDLIQARSGRTIAEIFQKSGESAFRRLERLILEETVHASQQNATVLSLGGGAFIDTTNQQVLRENGIPAVFLDAAAEELFRRCAQPGVVRPLLHDLDQFRSLYEERRAAYLKAQFCVETSGKNVPAIAEEITSRLGLEANSGVFK